MAERKVGRWSGEGIGLGFRRAKREVRRRDGGM